MHSESSESTANFKHSYFLPAGSRKWRLVFLSLSGSFAELVGIAAIVPMMVLLLDKSVLHSNKYLSYIYNLTDVEDPVSFAVLLCIAVVAVIILKNLFLHFINKYKYRELYKVYKYHSVRLLGRYFSEGILFIKKEGAGTLSHNVNSLTYTFVFSYLAPLLVLASDASLMLIILGTLFYVDLYFAIAEIIIFVPVIFFYYSGVGPRLKRAGKADNLAKREQWRLTMETFRGYTDILVNNAFEQINKQFMEGTATISRNRVTIENLRSLGSRSMETGIVFILAGLVIAFSLTDRELTGSFRTTVALFTAATIKLIPTVRSVISNLSSIRSSSYTIETLCRYEKEAMAKTDSKEISDPFGDVETIEMDKISFSFKDGNNLVKDFSLKIAKGEIVGIKGISGSGKSTLLNILLSVYKPDSGCVRINGIPLDPGNVSFWHTKIGYVSQDIFILNSSLADNIRLGAGAVSTVKTGFSLKPEEDNLLKEVVEKASLGELINRLPNGINSLPGESGLMLSGGERQRIAIARALYKKAPVLLLDEATSALDNVTEEKIKEVIKESGKTVVIISHRESILNICNRVVNID